MTKKKKKVELSEWVTAAAKAVAQGQAAVDELGAGHPYPGRCKADGVGALACGAQFDHEGVCKGAGRHRHPDREKQLDLPDPMRAGIIETVSVGPTSWVEHLRIYARIYDSLKQDAKPGVWKELLRCAQAADRFNAIAPELRSCISALEMAAEDLGQLDRPKAAKACLTRADHAQRVLDGGGK